MKTKTTASILYYRYSLKPSNNHWVVEFINLLYAQYQGELTDRVVQICEQWNSL